MGSLDLPGTARGRGAPAQRRFTAIDTGLIERPGPYEDLRSWLRTNALSAHLLRLPAERREPYLDAVVDALGPEPQITYIRLNIDATNPAEPARI
jgi:hypothetical protein